MKKKPEGKPPPNLEEAGYFYGWLLLFYSLPNMFMLLAWGSYLSDEQKKSAEEHLNSPPWEFIPKYSGEQIKEMKAELRGLFRQR